METQVQPTPEFVPRHRWFPGVQTARVPRITAAGEHMSASRPHGGAIGPSVCACGVTSLLARLPTSRSTTAPYRSEFIAQEGVGSGTVAHRPGATSLRSNYGLALTGRTDVRRATARHTMDEVKEQPCLHPVKQHAVSRRRPAVVTSTRPSKLRRVAGVVTNGHVPEWMTECWKHRVRLRLVSA